MDLLFTFSLHSVCIFHSFVGLKFKRATVSSFGGTFLILFCFVGGLLPQIIVLRIPSLDWGGGGLPAYT